MEGCARAAGRLALAAMTLAGALDAQAGTLYQGTLGGSAIVVELDEAADRTQGRYFYRRHRLDIALDNLPSAAGSIALRENADWHADESARPRWQLRAGASGGLEGQWHDATGRTLPIALVRVDAAALPHDADPVLEQLRSGEPYEFLRLSGLRLVREASERHGAYRLQWWREPVSGIRLFEVVDGYPRETQARINPVLRARLWKEVQARYACLSGGGEGEFDQAVTVRRLAPEILSVSVATSYYCGGAHPDFGDDPLNLDPRTGRQLGLEDVLVPGAPAPGRPHDDAWIQYRAKVFAPWIVAQLQQLYPVQMAPPGEGDDCDYGDEQVWSFPSWYATDAGLHLGSSFARAARACDDPDWSVLPWPVVRRHRGRIGIAPR